MLIFSFPSSIFWAMLGKIRTFAASKSRKVRSVNVMNATYSNGRRTYARAEAKSLATFTPLYDIYNQLVSLQVKLIPTNKNQNYGKQGQESHPY